MLTSLRVVVDLDVEVALVLEVIAQVADAAHQEVAVDGLFVEDRDVLFEVALGDFGAFGVDFDFGAAVGRDGRADAIFLRKIVLVIEGDVGGEAVLFVVLVADLAETALRVVLRGLFPAEPAMILRPFHDLFRIDAGVADDDRGGKARALAGIDEKGEGDLLVLGIALDFGIDLREIQAVALKEIANAVGGGLEVGVVVGCAELQAGGVLELALAGRHLDFAVNLDGAHEPLLGRADHQRDAVTVGDRFDLDVLIFAGGVKALDGVADVSDVERRAGLERDETREVGGGNRLGTRFVPDLRDGTPFVLRGRREIGSAR